MPAEAEQSRALTYREAEQIYVESEEYSLSESAWEAGFFIFTPAAGSLGSVFVLVAIMLNIICQLTFCVIAWTAFANPETSTFNNRDVIEQAKSWRLTDGHSPDRMDKASWVSLATRVCAQDGSLVFSTAQAGLLEEAAGYQGGFGTDIFPFLNILGSEGSILTTACLVLWYFTASREIFDCINVLNAICMIPNSGMCSRMLVNIDDMFVIDGLGWPRRLSLLLISFIRLGLTIWILIAGGIWLCLTSSLFDLILNAAALSFVFDLDEKIFAALCPPMVKGAISRTTPLKLKPETSIRGLGFKGPVALMVSLVFVYLLFENGVDPMMSRMQEVKSVMCDGPTEFVVEAGAGLGYAVAVKTKPYSDGGAEIDTLVKSATNQILSTNIGADDWDLLARRWVGQQGLIAQLVETAAEFNSALGKTSDDFIAPACLDELHPAGDDSPVRAYLEVLRFRTQRFNATRCSDFVEFCRFVNGTGTLVRSFCSLTCQCFTHMGVLVDRSGCSHPCNSMMKVELSSHDSMFSSCMDQPADVYGSPEVAVWLKDLETMLGVEIPRESISRHGCSVVSALQADTFFEPDKATWLPDALCGRSTGSNIAADNIQYQTLRFMCPVTCGCTLDFSAECPRSCKKGPGSMAVNTCSLGMCPSKSIANFELFPGIFCEQVDKYMKTGDPSFLGITLNATPAGCEMLTVHFSETCCCPGPCEPYAFCFINTQCGWCNASDACRGTPCAMCEAVGPCSSCFKNKENDGSGGSD
eukprot:TRINITY_DN7804_c0_g1_i7.p1 TRINITY_DN7804_c0_g1~~TRINITY_DN7804_c0_g1_i7.p1  ORF type:complete len:880 (-),score=98.20 TRINITY_DN7804_c0_g1_i7:314-2578(-)